MRATITTGRSLAILKLVRAEEDALSLPSWMVNFNRDDVFTTESPAESPEMERYLKQSDIAPYHKWREGSDAVDVVTFSNDMGLLTCVGIRLEHIDAAINFEWLGRWQCSDRPYEIPTEFLNSFRVGTPIMG